MLFSVWVESMLSFVDDAEIKETKKKGGSRLKYAININFKDTN